jgi:hydrogenase expression/formation protein HypD
MKYVDEFRDPAAARALVKSITELATGDEFKFMEVCGGHTHTIYRHGIEHLLPESIELVHGPGCPVCVIPMGRVDDAMWLAEQPNIIFTTFGDMMRVPGSKGNLIEAKARGADVRFVHSPLDALGGRRQSRTSHVVFFAVGFETTAPSTAVTLVGPARSVCATSASSATTSRSSRRSRPFSNRPTCGCRGSSDPVTCRRWWACGRTGSCPRCTESRWW